MEYQNQVERWGMLEVTLTGPQEGNPFTEQWVKGVFTNGIQTIRANGFYDGEGVYKVRCMPSYEGEYTFEVSAS